MTLRTEIEDLFEKLKRAHFPKLGKRIGDFGMYDSLIAGCASRAVNGHVWPSSEVPVPDDETARAVEELRQKASLSREEQLFLTYFDLLESLQVAMQRLGSVT